MLSGAGQVVALSPKALDLLIALVTKSGRIVDKEELMREVWPHTFVEENNLTVNISALRESASRGQLDQDYIQTVPRRGYRFFVASVCQASESAPLVPGRGRGHRSRFRSTWAANPNCVYWNGFLREAAEGGGRMIFITGEPGIGKTALSNAFLGHVRSRFPFSTVCRGRCVEQYGAGEPYLPVLDALSNLLCEPPANSLPRCFVLAHPHGACNSRRFLVPLTRSSACTVRRSALPKSACCAK